MVSALGLFAINSSPIRAEPLRAVSRCSTLRLRPCRCRPNPVCSNPVYSFIYKKKPSTRDGFFVNGERAGIRTQGHLIKSQVLYQLSYALNVGLQYIEFIFKSQPFFCQKNDFLSEDIPFFRKTYKKQYIKIFYEKCFGFFLFLNIVRIAGYFPSDNRGNKGQK